MKAIITIENGNQYVFEGEWNVAKNILPFIKKIKDYVDLG